MYTAAAYWASSSRRCCLDRRIGGVLAILHGVVVGQCHMCCRLIEMVGFVFRQSYIVGTGFWIGLYLGRPGIDGCAQCPWRHLVLEGNFRQGTLIARAVAGSVPPRRGTADGWWWR